MSPKPRNAGFSLLEVMCAILILGLGIVGLTQGMTTALISSKESELQTTAALIAAGRIELLRADGFLTEGNEESDPDESGSLYRWRQTVTRGSIDGLYEVEVVVENSRTGKAIYELKTMLFDPPLYSSQSSSSTSRDPSNSKRRERARR